jgi:uncharacterized protein (TIGR00290 family)
MKRVLVSWSSGKDSAWMLHVLRQQPDMEVAGLLTTLNAEFDRVSMHGVRSELLEAQAEAAGLPLWTVPLPWPCPNEVYEQKMSDACARAVGAGVECIAFGDLYLEDVREYREQKLKGTGLRAVFPLWQRDTSELVREMLARGLKARVTSVDLAQLPGRFAGRELNEELLTELPDGVDPCGENGEFHTFAYAGPMFRTEICATAGEVVERDGFAYADLRLGS